LDNGDLTPEKIAAKKQAAGHMMVSFLQAFRELAGTPAEHFHVGPTTQDILDTGLVLQMREAHNLILDQLLRLEEVLCERALAEKGTILMGRTHEQHAVPLTLGFVLAGWANEMRDQIDRAHESEKRWLYGTISGAVGTHNAFAELSDGPGALRLQAAVCERLGLATPPIDLHPRTDRFAEVGANLSAVCSSLGRIGLQIRSWQRSEVAEAEEPYGPERFSSSTMPSKQNPEASEQVEGLATVARALALAAADIQMADHRDSTRMPILYVVLPMNYQLASRALETTTTNLAGLVIRRENMIRNLNDPRLLGQAASERLMIALYKKTGRRAWAHEALHRCSWLSHETGRSLVEVIQADAELSPWFTPVELDALADLTTYTGTAAAQAEAVVAAIRERRGSALAADAGE
jgi:adenylosuccinate lyase